MKKTESVKMKKAPAPAAKAKKPVPANKTQEIKKTMEKRRRQIRHLQTALQAAIRIANAFGNQTVYRK